MVSKITEHHLSVENGKSIQVSPQLSLFEFKPCQPWLKHTHSIGYLEQTESFLLLSFISISEEFYHTNCSKTQSTKKMKHWKVSGDEDERVRKELAQDSDWSKAT